ncbi:uroporphyrinogen decarboxylase/cobalamine-independent methonine synthase family protein [Arenicellales bacterium IMCC58067]
MPIQIEQYPFPNGLHLLKRWQAGDADAKDEMTAVFDAAIAGEFDSNYSILTSANRVHSTASVHMLGLAILFDLYGIESWAYYNLDPYRYVRTNLAVSRLLGIHKFYTTWALYAFTCEPLGQKMMYPDRFPPGADPDAFLIDGKNWQDLKTPDFQHGVPKAIDGILEVAQELTGVPPLLQISAPYSLAADIYGQEPLLADVVNNPTQVNALLDHLGDVVLGPWMDHFFQKFPHGWVELSDASGSPFFIGPDNCINMSIRSIRQMLQDKSYANRVFDNNFRGDIVTEAEKKSRRSKRRNKEAVGNHSDRLMELTNAKVSVNPIFIMRLEADKIDISFYEKQAIARNLPLTSGIGSPQIDKNSIKDIEIAKKNIREDARSFIESISRVCQTVDLPDDNHVGASWPSHIYFEDINGESHFDLVEIVLEEVYRSAPLRD